MIKSILGSLLSNSECTLTNSDTGRVIMPELKVVKVYMGAEAAAAEKPIQITAISAVDAEGLIEVDISQAKVQMPATVMIEAVATSSSVVADVVQLFNDLELTINVSSRSITALGMVLTDVQLVSSAEAVSVTRVNMVLSQAPTQRQPYNSNAESPADAPVYGLGHRSPEGQGLSISELMDRALR